MQRAFPLALAFLAGAPAAVSPQSQLPLDERAQAVHVLHRFAFGPRPGDVERVLAMGIDRWLDEQLHPETIADPPIGAELPSCAWWTVSLDSLAKIATPYVDIPLENGRMMRAVGVAFTLQRRGQTTGPLEGYYLEQSRVMACRVMRAERSERQLLEVMTDFWLNHFSVWSRDLPARTSLMTYDRVTIRPHALGRFRDLLGAVAHSSAMLTYLDNHVSGAESGRRTTIEFVQGLAAGADPRAPHNGLNENFARELLELHTLGVDGGYTQADIIEVARAFTGWSHTALARACANNPAPACRRPNINVAMPQFRFDSVAHDAERKHVLGHVLREGRTMEDGEEVLDLLARHPSTARHIARKLAVRFISDAPPQSVIDRAAETFTRTDGDISAVVRMIATSPEFRAAEAQRAKTKSPLELVLSTRRAVGAWFDGDGEVIDALIDMGQPPFGHEAPDGWPETGAAWWNPGSLVARVNYARAVAFGELQTVRIEQWPAWPKLVDRTWAEQVDGVIESLLYGRASSELRSALLAGEPAHESPGTAAAREHALRHVISLVLGSPDFQRR